MMKFAFILLPILYTALIVAVSAWKTRLQFETNSCKLSDDRVCALNRLMADAAGIRQIPVRIYETSGINGMALPGGKIFITRGLYDCLHAKQISAEELASVIAHELGHVALGHSKQRFAIFVGQTAANQAARMFLWRMLPGIGPIVAWFVGALVEKHISRSGEFAADRYASGLLIKAGIGTGPQISLLQKLERLTGATRGGSEWMSSHPPTTARIEAIKKWESRIGRHSA